MKWYEIEWMCEPLRKCVFDVVKSRVDKDTRVVPCAGFYADSLVDEAALRKSLVGNRDRFNDRK